LPVSPPKVNPPSKYETAFRLETNCDDGAGFSRLECRLQVGRAGQISHAGQSYSGCGRQRKVQVRAGSHHVRAYWQPDQSGGHSHQAGCLQGVDLHSTREKILPSRGRRRGKDRADL